MAASIYGDDKNMATIRIKNLRLRTFIGFNEVERKNKQDVVINAKIDYGLNEQAVMADDESKILNYRTICKEIIAHVEDNRFLLLEKLTQSVLALVMEHGDVKQATIEVDKPNALRFSDSVSIELSGKM